MTLFMMKALTVYIFGLVSKDERNLYMPICTAVVHDVSP